MSLPDRLAARALELIDVPSESRNEDDLAALLRDALRDVGARDVGDTCVLAGTTERGDAGVSAIKELTDGLGAHSVVEAVGTQESMNQALHATRPGGHVGFVGVAHGVALDGMDLFWSLA